MRSKIFIRLAAPSDALACHQLDLLTWGEASAAPAVTFAARIAANPWGNLVATDVITGEIVGSVWTVSHDERPISTWWAASGQSKYVGVCNPYADCVFGVSVAANPAYPDRNILSLLIQRAGELAWASGKRKLTFGVPISDFHLWQHRFLPTDYIHLRRRSEEIYFCDSASREVHSARLQDVGHTSAAAGMSDPRDWATVDTSPQDFEMLDRALERFAATRIAGRLPHIGDIVPNYFSDPASGNYAVLVTWQNPAHPAVQDVAPLN